MSKKVQVFNLIAGLIIIGTMILHTVTGSNNLPYLFIILYIISYFLQKGNFNETMKYIGMTGAILLLILSIMSVLPIIFPFAP